MGKRAMTEAAKQAKAQSILSCAARMFLAADYEAVKMSHIAKEMHVSNGILFVYYPTKQTLFFSLLMREYHARIDALEKRIQKAPPADYEALCALIASDLQEQLDNTLYVRLESIRASILEKNIDPALALTCKQALYGRMRALADMIAIPGALAAEEILDIFHVQTALIAGFQQASELPASLREQFKQNGLDAFVRDARHDTLRTMRLYLRALKTKER